MGVSIRIRCYNVNVNSDWQNFFQHYCFWKNKLEIVSLFYQLYSVISQKYLHNAAVVQSQSSIMESKNSDNIVKCFNKSHSLSCQNIFEYLILRDSSFLSLFFFFHPFMALSHLVKSVRALSHFTHHCVHSSPCLSTHLFIGPLFWPFLLTCLQFSSISKTISQVDKPDLIQLSEELRQFKSFCLILFDQLSLNFICLLQFSPNLCEMLIVLVMRSEWQRES